MKGREEKERNLFFFPKNSFDRGFEFDTKSEKERNMRVGSFILSSCCTLTLIYLPIASSNAGKTPSFAQPNVRASSFTSKRAKARQSGCSFKAKSSGSAGWDENEIEKNISSGDFLDANVEKSTVWEYFGNLKASDVYGSDAKGRYKGNNDVNVLHNLGQGFPDSSPPPFAISALKESIEGSPFIHQYTRSAGHPLLVKEISERYSRHLNRNIDHLSEVAITVGASQALYLSLQTLINEGDEVILFEPFFDLYVNQIKMAGGVPVFVPLDFVPYPDDETGLAGSWQLNEAKLRSAFSSRTRAVILNSPHNPTGKVFTRSEMEAIADAVRGFDRVKVLSDEVYKFIIHSHSAEVGAASTAPGHTHFASLPGMWDRTLTVSSAGKTFSATGWQVGWCVGPSDLVKPIQRLLPYVQFCANSICQQALAITLRRADMPYEVVEEGKGVVYDTYYKVSYSNLE